VLQYVTLKAYKFPFVKILWGGVIITAIGILMSMIRRIQLNLKEKEQKTTNKAQGTKNKVLEADHELHS
jgi:cytochrome c biogenesis factor